MRSQAPLSSSRPPTHALLGLDRVRRHAQSGDVVVGPDIGRRAPSDEKIADIGKS